jgi:hypothetical protein
MPKRRDENQTAFDGLQEILRRDAERDGIELPPKAKPEKVPSAVRAGRLGGLKGGKARAKTLTPRKRKQIAKKAAKTRWQKSG